MIDEAIEGLPTSMDPYAPSKRGDMGIDMGQEKAAPTDFDTASEPPISQPPDPQAVSDAGGMEGTLDSGGILDPTTPVWKPTQTPNKKDLAFERSDGFKMRIRKIESVPGKWLGQIWKDDEVLDKGQLMIPTDVDPSEYVQKMADHMLDSKSHRDEQEETTEEPALGPEMPDMGVPGEQPPGMPGGVPGGPGGPELAPGQLGPEEDAELEDEMLAAGKGGPTPEELGIEPEEMEAEGGVPGGPAGGMEAGEMEAGEGEEAFDFDDEDLENIDLDIGGEEEFDLEEEEEEP
jgi:hypothetical protein